MFPFVNLKTKELDIMNYEVRQQPEKDAIIREIVMIFPDSSQIIYDKNDVACVLSYDDDNFGWHTILFSKVTHLQYKNGGVDWVEFYTSARKPENVFANDSRFSIPVETLTDIYKNTLKYL